MSSIFYNLFARIYEKERYLYKKSRIICEMNLKDIDKKLLNLIQEQDMCVPRVTKIAHKLGLPTSTVQSKLKAFQKEGIIKGYSAFLDGAKVGKGFVAYKFAGKKFQKETDLEEFGKKLAKIPEIQEVRFIVGDWDYVCKMRLRDEAHYTEISPKIAVLMDGCKGVISPKCFKDSHKIIVD